MPSDANLMVKSIGLSRVQGRKPCTLREAIRHNRRDIQAELGAVEKIDPRRICQNSILAGPPTWQQVLADAEEILGGAGVDSTRLRRDWVQAIEFIFSLDPNSGAIERKKYWQDCVRWLSETRSMLVLSADVHRDEVHEHLHCLVSPVHRGQLLGGKLIDKSALSQLRQSFWDHVAGPAGMRRPRPRMRGYVKEAAAEVVIAHLTGEEDPALHSSVWALQKRAIRDNPLPYLEMLKIPAERVRQRVVSKALP